MSPRRRRFNASLSLLSLLGFYHSSRCLAEREREGLWGVIGKRRNLIASRLWPVVRWTTPLLLPEVIFLFLFCIFFLLFCLKRKELYTTKKKNNKKMYKSSEIYGFYFPFLYCTTGMSVSSERRVRCNFISKRKKERRAIVWEQTSGHDGCNCSRTITRFGWRRMDWRAEKIK